MEPHDVQAVQTAISFLSSKIAKILHPFCAVPRHSSVHLWFQQDTTLPPAGETL